MSNRDDSSKRYSEELRWVRRPEGASRSKSRQSSGYDRDLLRDRNGKLLGPTESRPLTKEDRHRLGKEIEANRDNSWGTILLTDIFVPLANQALKEYVIPKTIEAFKNHRDQRRKKAGMRRIAKKKKSTDSITHKELAIASKSYPMDKEEYSARLAMAELAEEFAKNQKLILSQHTPADGDVEAIDKQVRELILESGSDVQAALLQGLLYLEQGHPEPNLREREIE